MSTTTEITIKDGAGASQSVNTLPPSVNGTLPVSGTFFQATQPVSLASLPLPAGASTEATLLLVKNAVTGTLAVQAAALPLPAGAATDASLVAIKTALGSPLQAGGGVTVTSSALPAGAATDAKVEAVRALLAGTLAVSGPLTSAQLAGAGVATDAKLEAVRALVSTQNDLLNQLIAQASTSYALADGSAGLAAGANTATVSVPIGGYYFLDLAFTGSGGSITLQRLGADGATWIDVVTRSAPGTGDPVGVPSGSQVRLKNESSAALTSVAGRLS